MDFNITLLFYFFITVLLSYLLGSIPNGLILSKIFSKKDPRLVGSGNIGATNVARSGGILLGVITLILDAAKGFIPVFYSYKLNIHEQLPYFAGLASFLGHIYPLYLKFKGGKGVATAIGIFLATTPIAVVIDAIIFFTVAFIWRYVSLASVISAISMPGIIKILISFKVYNFDSTILYFASIISFVILYKHRQNIIRLLKNKELKFGCKIK